MVLFSWTVSGEETAVKYTVEQRRVAVETYARFDCCAADTIRELGYPRDRKSLRSWYQEWKAEQDEGEPWRRGQRYRRYTDEQKQAAVDFYVSHGRRIARTIRHMGYPTHQLLARWIDELAPGERRFQAGEIPENQRCEAVRVLVVEEGACTLNGVTPIEEEHFEYAGGDGFGARRGGSSVVDGDAGWCPGCAGGGSGLGGPAGGGRAAQWVAHGR